jgi:N4-gp56 family major capsid protein
MTVANFIPTIWSARLFQSIHTNLVYGALANRNYEGEISAYGDTVKINGIGAVSVTSYNRNTDLEDPEILSDNTRTFQITESRAFHFYIDDVDKAQINVQLMQEAMREAGYAMAKEVDDFVRQMYLDALPANTIGNDTTPVAVSAAQAYELLVDLSVKLDESDTPADGRWVVVPAWFHGQLLKDDRFVKYGTSSQDQRLVNGKVGAAAGFEIFKSNRVPNTGGAKYKLIAGNSQVYTYAEQINQVEAYRPQKRFGDAVKGLHLFGGKTIRPEFMAVATVDKA